MAWWKDARAHAATLLLAAAVAGSQAPSAHADQASDKKAAHEAYERGARAFGQGSYSVAATEFARADELRPAPDALVAALKAAILAEDPVLAMTLVDRAAARPPSDAVAAQVARAKDRFAHKVGRLTILCTNPCTAKVGNESVTIGLARYYLAGNYVIEVTAAGAAELFAVQLPGGATMDWRPPLEAPRPALSGTAAAASVPPTPVLPTAPAPTAFAGPVAPEKRSLSPAWFAALAGVTGISAGVAVGFGLDTLGQHDAFVNAPTEAASRAGQDAQLRTNVLIGVTAATAIATAVIGYFTFRTRPATAVTTQAAFFPRGPGP
jgi:hypothetical protein